MKLTEAHLGLVVWCTFLLMIAIGAKRTDPKLEVAQLAPGAAAEVGTYFDHRGDGAIEFSACGNKLCGRVVWVREGAPVEACGREVIGDVAPVAVGVWDGGWILDPEIDQKFDVEITKISDDQIKVMGYLGSKELSETFVWKKVPETLKRCPLPSDVALAQGK